MTKFDLIFSNVTMSNLVTLIGNSYMEKGAPLTSFKGYRGFTAIELVVVVLIMAVLAAFAVPSFDAAVKRYRVGTAAAEISNALQFARANAIRTRAQAGVQSAQGCDGDWSCGIDAWVDHNSDGTEDASELIKTLPAADFNGLAVQYVPATVGAAIMYNPLGFLEAPSDGAAGGVVYVWPSDNPQTAAYTNTVVVRSSGEINIERKYVPVS
jgi:prepilin-type N-terminal cleavage/methylation domain-containing protein